VGGSKRENPPGTDRIGAWESAADVFDVALDDERSVLRASD
jgi:hypothetical protein